MAYVLSPIAAPSRQAATMRSCFEVVATCHAPVADRHEPCNWERGGGQAPEEQFAAEVPGGAPVGAGLGRFCGRCGVSRGRVDPPTSSLRQVAGSYHRSSGTKVERVGEVFGGPRGPAGDEDGRIRVGFDEGLALEHWIGSIPHGTGPRWLLLCYLSCDVVYFSLF